MPLIVAVIVYGGAFFGYAGVNQARMEIKQADQVQQHWLALKHTAIAKVAAETIKEVK